MQEPKDVHFDALASQMLGKFNTEVTVSRISTLGFLGGPEIAVITFALGAVASGFFKEAGADFWKSIRRLTGLFTEKEERNAELKLTFRFRYKNREIQVETTVPRNADPSDMDGLIARFWSELPLQCYRITETIEAPGSGALAEDVLVLRLQPAKDEVKIEDGG
ncbi:MAG: hypothetical protein WAN65_27310 [Candidatus Sulfotelmatobacter sp.]